MQNILSTLANKQPKRLAIGKFDGLHLGHKQLLKHLGENDGVLVINTQNGEFLTSLSDRLAYLKNAIVLELEDIKNIDGGDFIRSICTALPSLECLIVGYDFRFGRNRAYGAHDIKHFCDKKVLIIPQVKYGEIPLHSSVIKDFIRHGDMAIANAMLDREYTLCGNIIKGQGIGAKSLYPTINIALSEPYVLPSYGVYATRVKSSAASLYLDSVSFIGMRLSTDGKFAIESHILNDLSPNNPLLNNSILNKLILNNSGQNLDSTLYVSFIAKIRDNHTFSTLSALKAQIQKDIKQAAKICQKTRI